MKEKLIGVCLTQVHSQLNIGLLKHLYRFFSEKGYSLIVFNGVRDPGTDGPSAGGEDQFFSLINYDALAALIVLSDYFSDRKTLSSVIQQAGEHGLPVLSIGGIWNNCVSIINEYYQSYKELLNHMIRVHGAKDTFFINGFHDEDNSALRLQCYREALEENGLSFSENNVAYGYYWSDQARIITEELIRTRRKIPDAIFCANDTMAVAVCDTLTDHGYRVPEDVIVTGFDCLPIADIQDPRLATLDTDPEGLARLAAETLIRIFSGEEVEPILHHTYLPRYARSCGCDCKYPAPYNLYMLFRQNELLVSHENQLHEDIEKVLRLTDINAIFSELSGCLLPSSAVCLNRNILGPSQDQESGDNPPDSQMIAIVSGNVSPDRLPYQILPPAAMIPEMILADPGLYLVTGIYADRSVYGYYTVRTDRIDENVQLIKRTADVLNMLFNILVGRVREKRLLTNIENSVYVDPMTSLYNLRGASRWFAQYAGEEKNRESALALSVYTVNRYLSISENYGIGEAEAVLGKIIGLMRSAFSESLLLARINEDQLAVFMAAEDRALADAALRSCDSKLTGLLREYNRISGKPYTVELNSGSTVLDSGWSEASPENMIRVALGESYLNRLRSGNLEPESQDTTEENLYNAFSLMMEKNLLKFVFQPIVDAKTGSIYAYEALMRTDDLIGMSPVQVLSVAQSNNRLYDVERETLFGIMEKYTRNYQNFRGSKLFINTIPGYFLNQKDCDTLIRRFEDYLDCFIFELTEQDSISDYELSRIKQLAKPGRQAQIAIDDYGTGHSNIVNLLRYSPQVIKIDRYLISGIESDPNKQMFVKNTISFAHQNNIKALAEGVETSAELRTVIEYGIDLIQGFYTARPSENPIPVLSEKVRSEIIEENVRLSKYDSAMLICTAHDGDTLNLFELALQKYSFINIQGGTVTLIGEMSHTVDMVIRFPDNTDSTLILDNVNIKGATETTVQLGRNSNVTLIIRGKTTLNKEGILVPPSSTLTIKGDGDLFINNNRNYAVGIGANYNNPYGTIILDLDGSITMNSTGDKVVGIGGGRGEGQGIRFLNGSYKFLARGINVICIGSTGGEAAIDIGNASLTTQIQGNDAVSIGSLTGHAVIHSIGSLNLITDGERSVGIGSMAGTSEIKFSGGSVTSTVHCDIGTCLGTLSGETEFTSRNTFVRIHGEGTRCVGFGSLTGMGNVYIKSGTCYGSVASADAMLLGNEQTRVYITGGNLLWEDPGTSRPLSPTGKPLYSLYPDTDRYEQTFRDGSTSWTYTADRAPDGGLCVYIPQQ